MNKCLTILAIIVLQGVASPASAQTSEPTTLHARGAFQEYSLSRQHRAFATAEDGVWAWCAEKSSEQAARDCAISQCQATSSIPQACELAHVNSQNASGSLSRALNQFRDISHHHNTYLAAAQPKAFALSNANRFGYCFGKGSLSLAKSCALERCKRSLPAGADCRIVSENGASTIGAELTALLAPQREHPVRIEVSDGVSRQTKVVDGMLRYNRRDLRAELLTSNGSRLCRFTFLNFDIERPRFEAVCFGDKQFSGSGRKVEAQPAGDFRTLPAFEFRVSRGQSYLQVISRGD